MRTSSAKAKGRRLQNWVCEKISKAINLPWGKDEMIAPREMGQTGMDVRLVADARRRFPFAVECKNQETWSIHEFIKQAKENEEKGMRWLLFLKRNRTRPVVMMDAGLFFKIWRRYYAKVIK